MSNRYYCASPISGSKATLTGPESRHLVQVMRARLGDTVVLFDGTGFEFQGVIQHLHRDQVEIDLTDHREVNREPARSITLAVALPKGDRQKMLIEKCTELGVARVIPLKTKRCVAQPTKQALDRLRRGVIEASKQCGRNRLMEIGEACGVLDLLHPGSKVMMADPSGIPLRTAETDAIDVVAVGPEGGFHSSELEIAREQQWPIVSLGRRILRVETAAIAIAALMLRDV